MTPIFRVSTVVDLMGLGPSFRGERAALRGTRVHTACEAALHGEDLTDALTDGYVEGLRRWLREDQVTVLSTERRLVSLERRLTGRIDLAALVAGVPYIIDFKSGVETVAHGPGLAGYALLGEKDPTCRDFLTQYGARGWCRANLYLSAHGTARWKPRTDPKDTQVFHSALFLLNHRFDHGLLSVTDDLDAILLEEAA